MTDATRGQFDFCDEFGPEKVIEIYHPSLGLEAILVIDNVAAGPAIGGVRMAEDAGVEECFRLARAMSLKNASAGLAHGGGKSVIRSDPSMDPEEKERVIRAFAHALRDIRDYIPGPDMGTDEKCMAWIREEIGRSVGLPRELGGIPLDEIGATGFGLGVAAEVASAHCGLTLSGARIAIQGFGSVGRHAAKFLAQRGALLIAASDSTGAVHDPDGLDIANLIAHKAATGRLADFEPAQTIDRDSLIDVDCDIWIPAARPDAIRADNVGALKARLVVQGANIPVTDDAEQILHERGVLSVPDFIANAGGVICASVEYHGGTQAVAFQTIEEKIRRNTAQVLAAAESGGHSPRSAAVRMAREQLRTAMNLRRWR